MLPMAMAQSSYGEMMKSQGKGAILGFLFPVDNAFYVPYSGMNFATMDQFSLNLLL